MRAEERDTSEEGCVQYKKGKQDKGRQQERRSKGELKENGNRRTRRV